MSNKDKTYRKNKQRNDRGKARYIKEDNPNSERKPKKNCENRLPKDHNRRKKWRWDRKRESLKENNHLPTKN